MSTNKETRFVFAADLGGTHLRAAIVDADGSISHRVKTSTPRTTDPQDIVKALLETACKCAKEAGSSDHIQAISVAVPGTVDVENGTVVKAPNLPCLDGFDLAAALENKLQWRALVENDANAAAVGEMWRGAGRGASSIICLTLGTGVGGGIILDNKLWRGADNSAGEIGHMGVDPFGGVACTCGSRGCLEVYASATAIVRMTMELRSQYPHSSLTDIESPTAQDVYRAGTDGDELAIEVFRRMGMYLGIGLANLINLVNPQMIVIAGGVANGWELFEKHAIAEVRQRAFPLPAERVQIRRGECGDDAGLLGAARLAFTKL